MYAAYGSGGSDIGGRRGSLRYVLAGIEAGVVGALILVVWLMIASYFTGRSAWFTPNLFATTFFGGGVYRNHLVRASWTGIAAILAVYGVLGLLWGCVWRGRSVRGLVFLGALTGLAIYFLLFDALLPHFNPLIAVYSPVRELEIGHVLWGMALARSPRYARRIDETISPAPRTPPELQEPEPAVNSGEVIQ